MKPIDLLNEFRKLPQKSQLILIAAIIGPLMAFSSICVVAYFTSVETVDHYKKRTAQEINAALQDKNHAIRKRIQQAHVTVTVKRARVTGLEVETLDGSNSVGKHGCNIKNTTTQITADWDGIIQKDGFTEITIKYDNQYDKVLEAKITKSNALFNAEAVNWYEVGYALGAMAMTL